MDRPTDDVRELIAEVKRLHASGASDDAIADWLRANARSRGAAVFAWSAGAHKSVLDVISKLASGYPPRPPKARTKWRTVFEDGRLGWYLSREGRMLEVGDEVQLRTAPHSSEPGRLSAWRVVGVSEDSDPSATGRITLEPSPAA